MVVIKKKSDISSKNSQVKLFLLNKYTLFNVNNYKYF